MLFIAAGMQYAVFILVALSPGDWCTTENKHFVILPRHPSRITWGYVMNKQGMVECATGNIEKKLSQYFVTRWEINPPLACTSHTLTCIKKVLTPNHPSAVVYFLAREQLGDAPRVPEKHHWQANLEEASQSDKVWKESWSSSLSLSDLTLMDCFVVQGAGQVAAKLHYNIWRVCPAGAISLSTV